MRFPDYYPEDCPCPKSTQTTITVYRLVRGETGSEPPAKYFKSHKERDMKNAYECKGCGLSVYTNIDDAKKQLIKFNRKRNNWKIAQGTIKPESGKFMKTPGSICKSHATWWVPIGVIANQGFSILDISHEK